MNREYGHGRYQKVERLQVLSVFQGSGDVNPSTTCAGASMGIQTGTPCARDFLNPRSDRLDRLEKRHPRVLPLHRLDQATRTASSNSSPRLHTRHHQPRSHTVIQHDTIRKPITSNPQPYIPYYHNSQSTSQPASSVQVQWSPSHTG